MTEDPKTTSHDPIVLFIQGTKFKRDPRSNSESSDWEQLRQELQGTSGSRRFAVRYDYFEWSGNNLEQSRHQAARKLLGKFLELEKNRVPYHVVAHSHGGSVVWQALCLACAKKHTESLPYLVTWTTVGTPFLAYSIERPRTFFASTLISLVAFVVALWAVVSCRDSLDMILAGPDLLTLFSLPILFIATLALFSLSLFSLCSSFLESGKFGS